MTRPRLCLIAACGLLALAGTALAAPGPSIDTRQMNLERRIDQGVSEGSITPDVALSLRGDMDQIARLELDYRAHGLSHKEHHELQIRLDALSARIAQVRHDREDGYDRHAPSHPKF